MNGGFSQRVPSHSFKAPSGSFLVSEASRARSRQPEELIA